VSLVLSLLSHKLMSEILWSGNP